MDQENLILEKEGAKHITRIMDQENLILEKEGAKHITRIMDQENLILEKEIGHGSYGQVYRAQWQPRNGPTKDVAAKKFFTPRNEKEKKMIENEITILKECEHPNIVSFFDTIVHEEKIVILMEYAECGSLRNFLDDKGRKASDVARLNWMLQMAKALAYLHEQKICHRDIKPDNLVLTNNYKTLKLCDFGLVKKLATNNTKEAGTYTYMAPEVANGKGEYTVKCDVYSFGIVLWEVMSDKKPFHELEKMYGPYRANQIVEGARPDPNEVKPYKNIDHIKEIMIQCWKKNYRERPKMKGVAFILGIDRHTVDAAKIMSIKPLPSIKDDDLQL